MKSFFDKAKSLFTHGDSFFTSVEPTIDQAHLFEDLRIFLSQLAKSINDHLDYERRIGTSLSSDSNLILRFKIDDYTRELFEFLVLKGLSSFDHETVVLATIEVLIPPKFVRDQMASEYRRRIFAGLLVRIAEQSGKPISNLTRLYYDRLASQPEINGVQNKQVIEIYEEALKEIPIASEGKDEKNTFDPARLLERTLVACGAINQKTLKRIVSRRPTLEFFSALLIWSIVVGMLLLASDSVVVSIQSATGVPISFYFFLILLVVVYILIAVILYHQMRYSTNRRRTLIRMTNIVISSVSMSIKEVDDVLEKKYGTNIGKLRTVLLPRKLRR